ncbi:apoptosis-enhancing nuclease-like [Antedon mediterranea]|uniref:apoptosis-enhancing nuclease-like n=1 Tax=Antedon mediterranea TaxID=105859 RepID=UPI003AF50AA7
MNELQNTKASIKRSNQAHYEHLAKKSKTNSSKLLPRRIQRLLKWKEKQNKVKKNNANHKMCTNKNDLNKYPVFTEFMKTHIKSYDANNCLLNEHEDDIVALDCEMVGTGIKGCVSTLARCSIVNYKGDVIYDKYVKPSNPVTDYRTKWSGIREKDLAGAPCFNQVQTEVKDVLNGSIIVGHSLHHDFAVLKLRHSQHRIRDTAEYELLKEFTNMGQSSCTPSLRCLARCLLGRDIQGGEHCSVADARAALDVYKLVENHWEEEVKNQEKEKDEENNVSYMDDKFWPSEIFL